MGCGNSKTTSIHPTNNPVSGPGGSTSNLNIVTPPSNSKSNKFDTSLHNQSHQSTVKENVIKFKYSMHEHKKIAKGGRLQLELLAQESPIPTEFTPKVNDFKKASKIAKKKKNYSKWSEEKVSPTRLTKASKSPQQEHDDIFLEDMLDIFMEHKPQPLSNEIQKSKTMNNFKFQVEQSKISKSDRHISSKISSKESKITLEAQKQIFYSKMGAPLSKEQDCPQFMSPSVVDQIKKANREVTQMDLGKYRLNNKASISFKVDDHSSPAVVPKSKFKSSKTHKIHNLISIQSKKFKSNATPIYHKGITSKASSKSGRKVIIIKAKPKKSKFKEQEVKEIRPHAIKEASMTKKSVSEVRIISFKGVESQKSHTSRVSLKSKLSRTSRNTKFQLKSLGNVERKFRIKTINELSNLKLESEQQKINVGFQSERFMARERQNKIKLVNLRAKNSMTPIAVNNQDATTFTKKVDRFRSMKLSSPPVNSNGIWFQNLEIDEKEEFAKNHEFKIKSQSNFGRSQTYSENRELRSNLGRANIEERESKLSEQSPSGGNEVSSAIENNSESISMNSLSRINTHSKGLWEDEFTIDEDGEVALDLIKAELPSDQHF